MATPKSVIGFAAGPKTEQSIIVRSTSLRLRQSTAQPAATLLKIAMCAHSRNLVRLTEEGGGELRPIGRLRTEKAGPK